MKIYVGNISFNTDEATLRSAFGEHGDVDGVSAGRREISGGREGVGVGLAESEVRRQKNEIADREPTVDREVASGDE